MFSNTENIYFSARSIRDRDVCESNPAICTVTWQPWASWAHTVTCAV